MPRANKHDYKILLGLNTYTNGRGVDGAALFNIIFRRWRRLAAAGALGRLRFGLFDDDDVLPAAQRAGGGCAVLRVANSHHLLAEEQEHLLYAGARLGRRLEMFGAHGIRVPVRERGRLSRAGRHE